MKLVKDYSGLNFNELIELDAITYKKLVRDAFIDKMKQSEEGMDYLEQCYILTQTKPNKDELRKQFL